MGTRFKCICGASLVAEESRAGQRITCSRCAASVVIPVPPPQRGPAIKIDMKDLEQVSCGTPQRPAARPRAAPAMPNASPVPVSLPPGNDSPPKTMKANRKLEGKVCSICQAKIKLGEDLRICEHCKLPFHLGCWEENGGCGSYGCEGAKVSKPKLSFADFSVPRDQVSATSYAKRPEGAVPEYRPPHSYAAPGPAAPLAPSRTSGMAVASLVLGLVGPFTCGVGSLLAVIFGHVALSEIDKSHGQVTGRGMAVAGLVLGYLVLLIVLAAILLKAASANN